MHLFIDTNIYLAFHHLSSDDLEELKKLAVLVKDEKVKLYVTDQVKNEFSRNRDIKIADALKRLNDQRFNLQFPQMCKDYNEYKSLKSYQKLYEKIHSTLIIRMNADIEANELKADKTIKSLFDQATMLTTKHETLNRAQFRMAIGNPPGKSGSLGDALNWERY